jgi:hypothetical protein
MCDETVGRTCLLLYQRAREERKGAGGFVSSQYPKGKNGSKQIVFEF